jgi:hypothetical protein
LKQKNKIHNPDRRHKGKEVIRKCIATGKSKEPIKMIRFVLDPFGAVVPDLAEKLPGKGMWVTSCYGAISKAIEKRSFERSMHQKVLISNSFLDNIE